MAESQGSFFVPTIDIDLAWHTHQLLARRYQEDCLELVGRYVNQYVVSNLRRSMPILDGAGIIV